MLRLIEYIWLDGTKPVPRLRSKARTVSIANDTNVGLDAFPEWGFDGSSTDQASTGDSDCILKPVNFISCPIRKDGSYLVLCEVYNVDGVPHASNSRAILRHMLQHGGEKHDFWIGFEQEYTLYRGMKPLGWPSEGYPAPQGPYYCGVGADVAFGRQFVELHTQACIDAGLMMYGINAEVMPGQWEFQIGYRGIEHEPADPLTISDHRYLALWLLYRLGEDHNIAINISNKPIKGDWNGAGCHTNFSTKAMRDKKTGKTAINKVIDALSKKHDKHIKVYGHGLGERLTGKHETAEITHFSAGVSDRAASIRIPPQVAQNGCGYLEDRRPGANSDPYIVSARLLATILNLDDQKPPLSLDNIKELDITKECVLFYQSGDY